MLDGVRAFLLGEVLDRNKEELTRQNRLAVHYFAAMGIPVSLVNIAVQTALVGAPYLGWNRVWLLAYYVLLCVADRTLIPENCRHGVLVAYLTSAPVMVISILLGTVWDPTHEAITFLLYLVVLPVFVLDRPLRVMGVMLGWALVFCGMSMTLKDPAIWRMDLLHALQFFLSCVAVSGIVLKLRMDVLEHLRLTRYNLEHDEATGAQNGSCLRARAKLYVGSQLFAVLADLDHFNLVNDFYGHQTGNGVLKVLLDVLSEEFGGYDVYRYGGDEYLCVVRGRDQEQLAQSIDACKKRFHERVYGELSVSTSCSFGYVWGTPQSTDELDQMIQLADIYAHRATKQGQSKTIGSAFNAAALRAGIVESNMGTHARAYETNQLTGFPSVTYFTARSEELLRTIADIERGCVVGFFNLTHFRDYNEEFGFAHGDELIRFVADALREALPARHITYVTGSQFGALFYEDEAEPAVRAVNEALASFVTRRPLQLKAGFARYTPGDTVISLLDRAMVAHESIVDEKGVLYRFYDTKLDEQFRLEQYLISHVDEAIGNDWLQVYYQPIVRASDGKVCNVEALSRWIDPTYGFLSPAAFIGVLERERLIYKLSLHVVSQVLKDFARMERAGMAPVPVSVNLSRNDFLECDMVAEISKLVDASGYPHDLVSIEITESAFIDSQELLKREVERFRAAGFSVWMDDFGSEYSTLNLLQELDFDLVKIDMQFMRNFSAEGRNAIIVSDIIDMCRRMGILTLVEGIEERDQRDILYGMGCDKLQGYLFSRPRSFDELVGSLDVA